MSEGTFGLTGVDIEQRQKVQELQQVQQPQPKKKDLVTSIAPKKEEKKEIIENPQKSNTKFPPIEPKKGPQTGGQGQNGQSQGVNQQQQGGNNQNNQMFMSKTMRAKSSKSLVNVRKIDNLKTFIDSERQVQNGMDKFGNRNLAKKSDANLNSSYSKRLELEREKREKKSMFLDGYRKKIEQDFDVLYKQDDYENVVAQLKMLENKVKLQGEIRRNEDMLNRDQKEYNQIKYEIEVKQKQLNAIRNQTENLRHVFSTEEEKQKLHEQDLLYQDYESKYENELVVQMSLKYMMNTRKKLLLHEKETSEKMYYEYLSIKNQITGFEEQLLKNKQKHSNLQKQISQFGSLNAFNLNSRFQELLEDELSEYEDKNALHEIFKHEQERKDDLARQEKEAKKQELEQLHFERQKQQDKIKQEQRQMEQILNQKRKNMEELLKVSCVSDISELEERKIFLEKSNHNLKRFEQEFQEMIDKQKLEIEQLKAELTELKYIQKDSKKKDNNDGKLNSQPSIQTQSDKQDSTTNNNQNGSSKQNKQIDKTIQVIDEENLTANVNIEKFEQILTLETDHLQEKEYSVKRLERVVDEICLVFSRILFQLQPQTQKNKNIEVKREDLRNQITICGLKLEKIISFLAKKKDSLRVESINTDADNFQPPEYVGINPRSYLRQRDLDEQREFEENHDPKFEYREDDPDEYEAEYYLKNVRSKVHNGNFNEEDNDDKSNF